MQGWLRAAMTAAIAGAAFYGAAGAAVAWLIRRESLRDDPVHHLDSHALLSIVMCWPHDIQSVFSAPR